MIVPAVPCKGVVWALVGGRVTADNPAEYIHVPMCPRLAFEVREEPGKKHSSVGTGPRYHTRQPNSETSLSLQRVQPDDRIRMVFSNEFESILKDHNDRSIHPRHRGPSEFADKLFV